MFRVIEDPQFEAEVPVEAPDGSVQTLRTLFRAVPVAELAAVETGESAMAAVLDRAVIRFADLAGPDGTPLDAEDWRDRVLALPWVQTALWREYSLALYRARAGNSPRSAAPGPTAG